MEEEEEVELVSPYSAPIVTLVAQQSPTPDLTTLNKVLSLVEKKQWTNTFKDLNLERRK